MPEPPVAITLYVVVYAFWDADPARPAADCAGRWVPTWCVHRDRDAADKFAFDAEDRGNLVYAVHEIRSVRPLNPPPKEPNP